MGTYLVSEKHQNECSADGNGRHAMGHKDMSHGRMVDTAFLSAVALHVQLYLICTSWRDHSPDLVECIEET